MNEVKRNANGVGVIINVYQIAAVRTDDISFAISSESELADRNE